MMKRTIELDLVLSALTLSIGFFLAGRLTKETPPTYPTPTIQVTCPKEASSAPPWPPKVEVRWHATGTEEEEPEDPFPQLPIEKLRKMPK